MYINREILAFALTVVVSLIFARYKFKLPYRAIIEVTIIAFVSFFLFIVFSVFCLFPLANSINPLYLDLIGLDTLFFDFMTILCPCVSILLYLKRKKLFQIQTLTALTLPYILFWESYLSVAQINFYLFIHALGAIISFFYPPPY